LTRLSVALRSASERLVEKRTDQETPSVSQ